MHKVFKKYSDAVDDIGDGSIVMVGGFTGRGTPSQLLLALRDKGPKNLTIISNDACGGWKNPIDVDILIEAGMVKKVITSYAVFGSAKKVSCLERKSMEGSIDVELVPQGTLVERIRAGGAGIGAFFTHVGCGTEAGVGKEMRIINGLEMVMEYALTADFALIKAHRGDFLGNLVYRKSSRNFNPVMAMAAKTTIAEVERLEISGGIDPDEVMTPCVFIQRVVPIN